MRTTYSVLVVDDHDIVRQGLSTLFGATADLAVVGEAGDGQAAIDAACRLRPDLIMMDLLMPGVDGVTAIRSLRTACPDAKLAVLTSCEDEDMAFAAVEAGSHAFLLKSMVAAELLQAVRRIMAGEVVIHPSITHRLLGAMRRMKQPQLSPFAALSERELGVLRALAHGASNSGLADSLGISEKTVKSHVGSILAKLQLGGRTEAVAYAWRHGLMQD